MIRGHWLGGAAGAVALCMLSVSAEAAPLSGAAEGPKATANENALVQTVRWGRDCWRHRGHWHCDGAYRRPYYYGSGYPYYYGGHRGYGDPYYRGYYGPGFSFYFGGPRHRYYRY